MAFHFSHFGDNSFKPVFLEGCEKLSLRGFTMLIPIYPYEWWITFICCFLGLSRIFHHVYLLTQLTRSYVTTFENILSRLGIPQLYLISDHLSGNNHFNAWLKVHFSLCLKIIRMKLWHILNIMNNQVASLNSEQFSKMKI